MCWILSPAWVSLLTLAETLSQSISDHSSKTIYLKTLSDIKKYFVQCWIYSSIGILNMKRTRVYTLTGYYKCLIRSTSIFQLRFFNGSVSKVIGAESWAKSCVLSHGQYNPCHPLKNPLLEVLIVNLPIKVFQNLSFLVKNDATVKVINLSAESCCLNEAEYSDLVSSECLFHHR